MKKMLILTVLMGTVLWLNSCADLLQILNQSAVQKPRVSVSETKITGLSFDQINLNFTLKIDNPNAIGVSLAGFDYNLEINQKSFISGRKKDRLTIKSSASSSVTLPVTLKFADIYQVFSNLINSDSSKYKISFGLDFDLPVLGTVRIPVSTAGYVPMLKLPSLSFKGIKLDHINFSGAKLAVELKLKNPNAFSMLLENFDYGLLVNGRKWLEGAGKNMVRVAAKGEQVIRLPVSLDFLQMGSSLYQMLTSGEGLKYRLSGKLDLKSPNRLLNNLKLPFDLSGVTDLLK